MKKFESIKPVATSRNYNKNKKWRTSSLQSINVSKQSLQPILSKKLEMSSRQLKSRQSIKVSQERSPPKKLHKKSKSNIIKLNCQMPPVPDSRNIDCHSASRSLLKALETVRKSQKSNWSEVKIEHFDLGKIN